jgi:hypothetical protein
VAQSRDELVRQIREDQQAWRSIVDDVGRDRMDEPGPMGAWTFGDLAGHLAGWRNRRLAQLEARITGSPQPPAPWPPELEDDDSINDWIKKRDEGRTAEDLVADYDRSYDRLAAAVQALPDDVIRDPQAFGSLDGTSVLEMDWFGHLRDEHEPAIRAWLASRPRR